MHYVDDFALKTEVDVPLRPINILYNRLEHFPNLFDTREHFLHLLVSFDTVKRIAVIAQQLERGAGVVRGQAGTVEEAVDNRF